MLIKITIYITRQISFFGRSGEAQTRGLRIPNAARYQLRYTPIVIKLWSSKWSNLWSNTVLTAFYHFPNRPKSARLKGFRRFSCHTVRIPSMLPNQALYQTELRLVAAKHNVDIITQKRLLSISERQKAFIVFTKIYTIFAMI